MNIVLIGPRGCGKTKVSNHLAKLLDRIVYSLDALICYEAGGLTIPEMLAENEGDWRTFRQTEYELLEKASKIKNGIIDCGGGIVVDVDDQGNEFFSERKAKLLKRNSVVIYLNAPRDAVVAKIAGDSARPSLSREVSAERIYDRRKPWYQQVADYEIDVLKGERKFAAERIVEILSEINNG